MFLFNLLLAIAWAALSGRFDLPNLVVGYGLGYALLWIGQAAVGPSTYFQRSRKLVVFALFYIWKLVLANLRVAYDVLTPTHHMRPGILQVPLEAKTDGEITLLANLITLTPGTLSLDVSADRRVLYLHAMYIDDLEALRREIKEELERRVLEVLR
jgi:multicomponent Na+:H+ antiporter subunit E